MRSSHWGCCSHTMMTSSSAQVIGLKDTFSAGGSIARRHRVELFGAGCGRGASRPPRCGVQAHAHGSHPSLRTEVFVFNHVFVPKREKRCLAIVVPGGRVGTVFRYHISDVLRPPERRRRHSAPAGLHALNLTPIQSPFILVAESRPCQSANTCLLQRVSAPVAMHRKLLLALRRENTLPCSFCIYCMQACIAHLLPVFPGDPLVASRLYTQLDRAAAVDSQTSKVSERFA